VARIALHTGYERWALLHDAELIGGDHEELTTTRVSLTVIMVAVLKLVYGYAYGNMMPNNVKAGTWQATSIRLIAV
jgi:hypothetical protein